MRYLYPLQGRTDYISCRLVCQRSPTIRTFAITRAVMISHTESCILQTSHISTNCYQRCVQYRSILWTSGKWMSKKSPQSIYLNVKEAEDPNSLYKYVNK